jgi:phosphoglycolate phosphatase
VKVTEGYNMRTVVFDLDGTLADTSADLLAAANSCFRALGHGEVLDARDSLIAFHGGRAMLRAGFDRLGLAMDEDQVERLYPVLLEAYRDGIDRETRLYPGAVAAVQALKAAGWRLAVCTNKPEALAELLLARLGVRDLFDSLVGADTFAVRKPDPLPYRESVQRAGGIVARSVLIGDTETDALTGVAAGVPVVLVTFGPEGAAITRLRPTALLDSFADLGALVERLVPPD